MDAVHGILTVGAQQAVPVQPVQVAVTRSGQLLKSVAERRVFRGDLLAPPRLHVVIVKPALTHQHDRGGWAAAAQAKSVLEAKNPEENILIMPNDVISVPKAELVYVIGAVKRSGGFVLAEKEQVSALQALSLAEGLDRGASPKRAKILRQGKEGKRLEIAIDVKKIMSGKANDVPLVANDILFIPSSSMRTIGWRSLEAGMAIGTGWAIYRR
mgnify:CR=1 FL=1